MGRGIIAREDLPPNFLALLDRERGYNQARREWTQYQGWLKHRNPVRAELEARYGYDCKHAMHLVRLLRMASEILSTGRVQVRRPDRDELLAVKAGAWSYDELIERAEALHRSVGAAARVSPLPEQPDEERIDALCQEIIARVLSGSAP